MGHGLSDTYADDFRALLVAAGRTPGVEPDQLAVFWPMVGARYTGELMVVGRAVNGWIDSARTSELGDEAVTAAATAAARRTSEGSGGCPMRWVTEAWGRGGGKYSTARSAFWRLTRRVLALVDADSRSDPLWASRLAWSNLAKLAPCLGGNPGGQLLELQRRLGPRLLAEEIAELEPKRILVLAGEWWFEPFGAALGLLFDGQGGRVQSVIDPAGRLWVVAPHPQGKPRALLDEVVEAFG